jgi:hypothetical protein
MFALDLGNGLTLEGEVKAGLRVKTEDDGYTINPDDINAVLAAAPKKADVDQKEDSDDTRVSLYNSDAGEILRTRLVFSYSGDKAGAKIRLQSADGSSAPVVNKAYGWANFLDKKIVVYGGRAFDDLWGLGKLPINAFNPSLDGITGVRAEFKLVDNLSFGFALPLDQVQYANVNTAGNGFVTVGSGNRTLGAVFGGAVIGGLYKTDIIAAAVGLKLYPAINSQDYGGSQATNLDGNGKKGYGETPSWVEVIAGVSAKPIDPLTVVLDAHIDSRKYVDEKTFFGSNKIGFTRVGLKGEYAVIPALTAFLKLDLLLQNEGAERAPSGAEQFTQYYKYDKDDSTKRVKLAKTNYVRYVPVETYGDMSLGFEIGGTYKASNTISAYLNIGSDNLLWLAGDVEYNKKEPAKSTYSPGAGLYVKPGVKIDLGGPNIEIFDKIDKIGAADSWYVYEDTDGTTKDGTTSPVTNQFQVELVWKF